MKRLQRKWGLTEYYCARGHWVAGEQAYRQAERLECRRCTDAYNAKTLGPLGDWWDETTLAPDAELAVDLAEVRARTAEWSVWNRLWLGVAMPTLRHPYPGGRG